MNEIKLIPKITLDSDFIKILALDYVRRLKYFKGKDLQASNEQDGVEFTGGIIISIKKDEAE